MHNKHINKRLLSLSTVSNKKSLISEKKALFLISAYSALLVLKLLSDNGQKLHLVFQYKICYNGIIEINNGKELLSKEWQRIYLHLSYPVQKCVLQRGKHTIKTCYTYPILCKKVLLSNAENV